MKHYDHDGWHVECHDDAACKVRRDAVRAKREEARAAKRVQEGATRQAAQDEEALLDQIRAGFVARGWVRTSASYLEVPATPSLVVFKTAATATTGRVTVTLGTLTDGTECARDEFHGYDDWRSYTWAPKAIVLAALLAYAQAKNITCEKAQEWVGQYNGCEGSELYHAVLGIL